MSEYRCEKQLTVLFRELTKNTEENLKSKLYSSQLYELGIGQTVDAVLTDLLNKVIEDEKFKTRLVKQASRQLLHKKNIQEKKAAAAYKKALKLWKITKGKIPCIKQCGYLRKQTKEETLSRSNTFACRECSEKAEREGKVSELFNGKTIYQIVGIE